MRLFEAIGGKLRGLPRCKATAGGTTTDSNWGPGRPWRLALLLPGCILGCPMAIEQGLIEAKGQAT